MKSDMRVTFPLWIMNFILLIAVSIYFIGTTALIEGNGMDEFTFSLSLESNLMLFAILFVLIWGTLITFFIKLFKHNRKYPDKKLSPLYLTPPEYLEDDELFQQATGQATKKVYTFFVTAIPVLAVLYLLLPIGKMWMVIGLLLLGFMQYLIYYLEIRKYITEE
ncbi:hypothetical protein JSQ81_03350 [Sporosarcina sp. Marseille-Q4063]|uniref:hypothetical protein n=1 Tax=Sporosarcina sp. Marseille-Q4063 TaxID=2810514 RepID=UPI001BAFD763|nr:hypothetical protein [Sporosarcina sp. Marseille-Q4063]QUW22634.1 hypothetical protein JSQ81_03350 [Sporosarcina sp. Marseille-Q4063]